MDAHRHAEQAKVDVELRACRFGEKHETSSQCLRFVIVNLQFPPRKSKMPTGGLMDWDAVRAEMPVTQRWAFFDHAAVAPLSARAQRALAEYADDLADNGDVYERRWVDRVEYVRTLFGQLLNAHPLDIAFV